MQIWPSNFVPASLTSSTRATPCAPGTEWPKTMPGNSGNHFLASIDVDQNNGNILLSGDSYEYALYKYGTHTQELLLY